MVTRAGKRARKLHPRHWPRWVLLGVSPLIIGALVWWGGLRLIKSHTFQLYGVIVDRVHTDQKVVALTFDDGPLPKTTLKLLDILDRNDVKATFFQLGKHIAAHPELTRAVALSGNEIGNHSYSHHGMAFMSGMEVAKEIEDTDTLLRANGYGPVLFRPPYGDKLFSVPRYMQDHGRTTVMWNINPDDHEASSLNPDMILTDVLSRIRPGSIIVLHPEYEERIASLDAVEPIIKTLKKMGYQFVTVSQLLQYK